MRRVPDPRASLAFLGPWLWEGEAGSCQVLALGPAGCQSACVSLIRPFVQPPFLSFPLAPPSYTPAGVTKMPLWGLWGVAWV